MTPKTKAPSLTIVRQPLSALHLDPRNPRQHPDDNLMAIQASLRRFGQQKPIVVRPDGLIVAGNGTYLAAQQEGWTEIDTVVSDLPAEELTAYGIGDNATGLSSTWDEQLLAQLLSDLPSIEGTGYDEAALEELLASVAPPREEEPERETDDLPPMSPDTIPPPFPWFGGKRRVAPLVWAALGDVDNYVEPFAGSLAVLLGRPKDHEPRAETVNDADSYLANFWRAVSLNPEATAEWTDWPVNETDLLARHLWLVNEGKQAMLAGLESDPDWFDPKIAGWWVWGINAWIGSGWCSGDGPWVSEPPVEGETSKRPHLGDAGRGVNRQLPHLGDAGRGVNRKRPHLMSPMGVHRTEMVGHIHEYFAQLAERLRRVRVCVGDWSRVATQGALTYGATVGVFLDPPYDQDVRTRDLYRVEGKADVAAECREWAIANGDDPRLRIVLAGYEQEHKARMPDTWRMHTYSASKAYGTKLDVGGDNAANRHYERLWFSPHCLPLPM